MKRLAVLGHPVSHSRSPVMQTAALEALGLAGEWSYEAIDIAPAEFAERTAALEAEGFVGANVTIPHKEAALALSSERSAAASEIGAANTLSFSDRAIFAENTDWTGLLAALGESPRGKGALVLGAGGAARAAVWGLAREGARVEVWNRTPQRAEELAIDLAGAGEIAFVPADRARSGGHELIVNCTAVGMPGVASDDPLAALPLGGDALGPGVTLVDLVYGGGESALAREARERGAGVVDGLEVLVRQGADSLHIWTGEDPPLDVMRDAARDG